MGSLIVVINLLNRSLFASTLISKMGMGIETCAGHKGDRGKKVTKLPKRKTKRAHAPKRKFVKDVVVEESEGQACSQVHQAETRIPSTGQKEARRVGNCDHAITSVIQLTVLLTRQKTNSVKSIRQ